MIEVIRTAAQLQDLCETENWRFCFIGGLALQCWGEPRETVDVDVTLLTGFGGKEPYVEALLDQFESRIEEPRRFALKHRVLLLRAASGVGIDVALAGLPFEECAIERSRKLEFPGDTRLRVCSAEDLIVMKAFAARSRDWADVESVIVRRTGLLDWAYIRSQLRPLVDLKGAPEIMKELEERRIEFEK